MRSRTRKLLGPPIILAILVGWCWLAVTINELLPQHPLVQMAFFAVAGLGWGLPVIPLMSWMNRGGGEETD